MKRPMFISLALVLFTVLLSFYVRKALLFCGVGLLILLAFCVYKQYKGYYIVAICLSIAVFVSLFLSYSVADRYDELSTTQLTENFTVLNVEKNDYGKYFITAKCENAKYLPENSKIMLNTYGGVSLKSGDRIIAKVKIFSLKSDPNRKNYYSEGIYGKANIVKIYKMTVKEGFLKNVYSYRTYIKNTVEENLNPQTAATVNGITMGDKSLFTKSFSQNVRRSGVSHVMVVSGMHLAIIMNFIFFFIDGIIKNRFIRFYIVIGVILLVCGICGFTMSVIRAGVMYLLISLAYTLKRDTDSFNVLCGAVVLILIFSPFAIFNIGFELSVFATFAVAVIAPKINEKIKINSKALKAVAFVATNSLMAQIVTLPITVYYFESISLIAPITNVLISYAVTFDLILSLIGVISNFFFGGAVSRFVFLVADILTKYINTVINKLGEISFASVKLSGVFAGLFALTVFVIIIVLYTCNHKEILVKLKLIKAGEENVDNI